MKTLRSTYHALAAVALAGAGMGQTKIDLGTQSKAVNFSQAESTRPSKTGTTLPATCVTGETFLKLDAAPGRNVYVCTATNQWTAQDAGAPVASAGNLNSVLASNGSSVVWQPFGGDVSGAPQSLTVSRILGRPVAPAAPSTGQVLTWNGSSWSAQTVALPPVNSVFGRTGTITAQAGDYSFTQLSGQVQSSQLPTPGGDISGAWGAATVSGLQNRPLAATAPMAGQVLAWSGSQWQPQSATGGVSSVFGRMGAVTGQAGDYSFSQISGTVTNGQLPALGGDLEGTLNAATVSGLQNRPVSTSAPTTGQVLTWNGSQWQPQTAAAGGVTSAFGRSGAVTAQTGDYSADQITNAADVTKPNRYAPGTRQTLVGNATSPGLQLLPTPLPAAGQAGDMVVDSNDSNQLKVYNGSSWITMSAAGHGNYAVSFSGQATVTVAGSTHGLGTANLLVGCYDNSTPANMIEPSAISVNPTTYDVTVQFPAAQSGRCIINGFSGTAGSGGSGGAVSTVFGRTGDVVAVSGDYSFSQISGTVASSQMAPGLDAAKIGTGSVSNQAYGYLANVTSDIQGQLNGKAAVSHTHTVGGDVSGMLGSTVVTGIQGRTVSSAAPADGQTLAWSGSANQWQPAWSSGGTGGVGMAAQLGDFAVTKTNPTTLTIGPTCSAATPCNVRFGSRVYSFTTGASATLTSGAGTAFFYISVDGQLTVGHTMTVTCSAACAAASGVTAFPVDSIPLYSWNAAGGSWADSGTDWRSEIERGTLLAGSGIVVVEAGGQSTVAVDSTVVPMYLKNSVSLDFPLIAAGTCSADLTFTLTGALVGDAVAPGWPSSLESGLVGMMRVSAADQIAVRLCAMGRDVDPGSAVFAATIIRGL